MRLDGGLGLATALPGPWERAHALGVIAVAGLTAAAVGLAGAPPESLQLPLLAVAVLALGVPHGALDHRPARRLLRARCGRGTWWAVFLAGYLTLAGAVLAAFALWPRTALVGFLSLSVLHFGLDAPTRPAEHGARRWLRRLAWGLPAIALPCALRPDETAALFTSVAGAPFDPTLVAILGRMAALVWAVSWLATTGLTRLRLALYPLLFAAAPPLVAFCVFFCVDHSLRCLLHEAADEGPPHRVALEAVPAVVATAVLALLLSHGWLHAGNLDTTVLRVVFQGLAALTLPHMTLWFLDRQLSHRPAAR
ncbi:MAG: Brp/Blh family beta-carotene 15,15'-dioxygenase [Acidobacteriota bacterium]